MAFTVAAYNNIHTIAGSGNIPTQILIHIQYCQAQPKSKCSWAELAIKSDSNQQLHNRGSIKQAE